MDRKQVVTVNMMHTCPMTTGTVPHVGGPVIGPGSVGVKINGVSIALQGDTCQCQGPPDSIIQGCPGVTINGTPIAVQQSPTAHGGTIPQGVTGVVVVSKNESVFEISQEREPVIYNLQWIKDTLVVRDSKVLKVVTLGADTRNIADGEEVRIKVQATNQQITELSGKVQNNRVEVEWEVEEIEDVSDRKEEKEQKEEEKNDWLIETMDIQADRPQTGETDCVPTIARAAGKYLGMDIDVKEKQKEANKKGGVLGNRTVPYFQRLGIKATPLWEEKDKDYYFEKGVPKYKEKEAIQFIVESLQKNHPVYLGFSDKEMADKGMGHAVLVTEIKYKSDFSKFKYIKYFDPQTGRSTGRLVSLENTYGYSENVYNIISLSKFEKK